MEKTTGGRIMAEMLKAEGVEKIFGIIDGTYLKFFASCVELGMEMVSPRHESTAAHMAGAYARLTGNLGVFMASNGPGVANVLPGVAVENGEGNRLLLITSSRRPQIAYPDRGGAFQCFDQVGVIAPMAKWSNTVKSIDRLPEIMRAALRACWQGRPGVVHVDVPENLVNGKCAPVPILQPERYRRVEPIEPPPGVAERAARLLTDARLPLLQCGSGVIHSEAYEEVAELAELLHAPVTTSWAGRGILPETNPLAWPMVHVKPVTTVRCAADMVLCLGSDLGETDWWAKPPYWGPPESQKFIQVDIDESILGRNRPLELAVHGDVKVFLRQLLAVLKGDGYRQPLVSRRAEVDQLAVERDEDRANLDKVLADRSEPMITGHVGASCRTFFDDDAVVVFDGGNSAVWGNFYSQIRQPNCQLGTHHFGHLGAGLGQALGAAVARPSSQVYCLIGDGAMGFHPQEIESAVRNDLKVIFLVCCDKQWGMVKLTQKIGLDPVRTLVKKALGGEDEPVDLPVDLGAFADMAQAALKPIKKLLVPRLSSDPTINADLHEIQWDKLAESMGAHGERVASPDELEPALQRCVEAGKCGVIHVDVNAEKHLWAPGLMHFKAMHEEPKGK